MNVEINIGTHRAGNPAMHNNEAFIQAVAHLSKEVEAVTLAAKAAGLLVTDRVYIGSRFLGVNIVHSDPAGAPTRTSIWNSMDNDGDSARLAGTLKINILYCEGYVQVQRGIPFLNVGITPTFDVHAATRRAVTLFAAKFGKE